ncbi:MAG: 50S ribosomal protein L31e [Candidatus Nanoarchaeia archaeon]|nr:50S ribosomal protein L31e [Candidatus Haiyanarchaeum thermophilum]MCW1302792.1 50S ribosomal protein L31e [Candidatus Haiyanarchaeum thermophilum]MCW1304110.1 50S ribosomal protein L31e [Candidatus Haiyanarchaeum thermophilum]MCW1306653.1 50S ribosomal protein L31e [Candidatus Haiyanarchaeum thermophilum]MCW1307391.1 50S ribosomal protein L31e [Candidatus Haiyanarchaeum thermophilum]
MRRIYTVNLRREILKVARWKRTKKAVSALRNFVARHMKVDVDRVKISEKLNRFIWSRGGKNPITKFKITVDKDEAGNVKVDLYEVEVTKTGEAKQEK